MTPEQLTAVLGEMKIYLGVEIFSQRQRLSPKTMNKMGDKYSLWEKGELIHVNLMTKDSWLGTDAGVVDRIAY